VIRDISFYGVINSSAPEQIRVRVAGAASGQGAPVVGQLVDVGISPDTSIVWAAEDAVAQPDYKRPFRVGRTVGVRGTMSNGEITARALTVQVLAG
jgi:hypothetical protein